MKHVHVECLPDETLVNQLGVTKKLITHHFGKSRVMKRLRDVKNEIAMVDEDPGTAKTSYEQTLKPISNAEGVLLFEDTAGNKVIVLQGKLEDWIIEVCKRSKIDVTSFGLPSKPDDLHGVINQKLKNFEKLIGHLLENKNKAIHTLKEYFQ